MPSRVSRAQTRAGGASKRARKGVKGRGWALVAFRWFEGLVEGWLTRDARAPQAAMQCPGALNAPEEQE
eukprot:3189894-Prymnesium_polylepis.1